MSELLTKLSQHALDESLNHLNGWELVDGKLHKEIKFKDFISAFAFMTRVAMVAERDNHHPEWCNIYNRVVIDLVTHESGGITQKDIKMANFINSI